MNTDEICIINEYIIICALDYRVQLLIRWRRAAGDGADSAERMKLKK